MFYMLVYVSQHPPSRSQQPELVSDRNSQCSAVPAMRCLRHLFPSISVIMRASYTGYDIGSYNGVPIWGTIRVASMVLGFGVECGA